MSPTPELKRKLKLCETDIINYVSELEFENAKLQRQVAKLQVDKMSSKNRIMALQKELNKFTTRNKITDADVSKWFNPSPKVVTNSPELQKLLDE